MLNFKCFGAGFFLLFSPPAFSGKSNGAVGSCSNPDNVLGSVTVGLSLSPSTGDSHNLSTYRRKFKNFHRKFIESK
ncbi:MAG: hypothetical protein U7127_01020 [Phormidium sp.]